MAKNKANSTKTKIKLQKIVELIKQINQQVKAAFLVNLFP